MNQHFKIINTILIVFVFVVLGFGSVDDSNNSTSSKIITSVDETKSCLINYDWVYPSLSNPTGAWKFLSDGTFSSSTKMFGGMSTWGKWSVNSPGKVKIIYTKTTEGYLPEGQTLTMSSCSTLLVGSTSYSKY